MKRASLTVLALSLACDASAAGYSLYEQGARALGMGGAFTAIATDPSAIFYNPAGLALYDEGQRFMLSPSVISFGSEFAGQAPSPGYGVHEETEDKVFFPVAGYYTRSAGRVAAGVGVYEPYGLEVAWKSPDTYTGRFISTRSKVRTFYAVPTVAVALTDDVRVGVGAELVFSKVELERHLSAFDPFIGRTADIGTVALESATNFDTGVNFGLQWLAGDRFAVGATYRSKVVVHYEGEADFTRRDTGDPRFDPIVAATFPPDQGVRTTVPFPAQGSIGVAYMTEHWMFAGDFNWTWWDAFDQLTVEFPATHDLDLHVTENWKGVANYRFGVQYEPASWSYRAGYYFDKSPQPKESLGPLLPDADRHGVTLGVGKTWEHTTVDAYALQIFSPKRSTDGVNRDGYDGTYSNRTFVAGASLTLHFE